MDMSIQDLGILSQYRLTCKVCTSTLIFCEMGGPNDTNYLVQVRENKMLLVVRDPWERLLSAYRDKLEATTGPDQVDLALKHGKKDVHWL